MFLSVLLVFCYIVAAVVFGNFVPKIGPENLGTKLLVEGWPLIVGLLVLPVWISCLWNARANSAGNGASKWRKWALFLTLVEVSTFMQVPLQAAKPVTDAISGPDVIAIKGCDNYSQTEVDRYISHSFTGKRKTVIKYSIKFDLITTEGEAIHFEFEDTKDEPELYVPLVKFCKDKGTSAVLKRYPNTEIVEDFQVK
ncbi:hypothetical protein CJ186_01070 [Actinomyces graevenitzii]|uniref:hypothetical protein n=1 Tax=Actinomyces graevenitzii TaxID=55565 RepID=UPI000C809140|nr:hypothetical protein [Actinomyces graevenitzii]PMC92125.1 hypothetical protein CJ186_01070 [Actinomyces graevenitzii]